MKKTIIALLLVLLLAAPLFAIRTMAANTEFSVMFNTSLENGRLEKKNIGFLNKTSVNFTTFLANGDALANQVTGYLTYIHPLNGNANEQEFIFLGSYEAGNAWANGVYINADIMFNAKPQFGSLKASTVRTRVGWQYNEENIRLGATEYESNFYFDTIAFNNVMPFNNIGFTYSFDEDPTVSGFFAAFKYEQSLDTCKPFASAKATFHVINEKLQVEDARVIGGVNWSWGAANMESVFGYQYSYNKGPEENGFVGGLMNFKVTSAMVDLSANAGINVLTSLHIVDNKPMLTLDRVSVPDTFGSKQIIVASVAAERVGANIIINGIEYVRNEGIKLQFATGMWTTPYEDSRVKFSERATLDLNLKLENGIISPEANIRLFGDSAFDFQERI